MSNVAVIDSGGANIASVCVALKRLGANPVFTDDAAVISAADRVVLPGVGAAASAMQHLMALNLIECIRNLTQPVLGICLGMQLLFESSDEGNCACLGIIPGRLKRMSGKRGLRVPHMGWNQVSPLTGDPLMQDIEENPWFYFVHSYAAGIGEFTLAQSTHGEPFSAIVRNQNFMGTQFHPERSSGNGAQLLKNFMGLSCK